MRKPRSDSKLKTQLKPEQRAELAAWLLSGVPYHRARKMVKKEFGVSTSMAALSDFWETYCSAELLARRKRAVTTADEIAAEAAARPGKFDAATIDALKQKAFELAISPGADPKEVKAVFSLVLKAKDQDLEERQLEQKIREYENRIAATDKELEKAAKKGGITPDTLQAIKQKLNLM